MITKDKREKVFLLLMISLLYFSSSFFWMMSRYKIETYLFIFLIPLFIILNFKETRKRIKLLFSSFLLIFLVSFPFYLFLKCSNNFWLGSPSMALPYFDNLQIDAFGIEKNRFYFESEKITPLLLVGSTSFSNINSLLNSFEQFKRNNVLLENLSISHLSLLVLILLLSYLSVFNKDIGKKIIFVITLLFFSLLSFLKIVDIWVYFTYVNFLFEAILLYLLFKFGKNKKTTIYLLALILELILLAPSISGYYSRHKDTAFAVNQLKEARTYFGENDIYAISNRRYEVGNYLDIKLLGNQQRGFDFLTNPDQNWDYLYNSFTNKDVLVFREELGTRGLTHVINCRFGVSNGKYDEAIIFFERNGLIKKEFENNIISIYRIVDI